jgi:hypothetical protein
VVILSLLVPTLYLLFIHDAINASGTAWTRQLSATVGAFDMLMIIIFSLECLANVIAYRKKYIISWFSILDVVSFFVLSSPFLFLSLSYGF